MRRNEVSCRGTFMFNRDIVVAGGSAGGIAFFKKILASLPEDFSGSICIRSYIGQRECTSGMFSTYSPLPLVQPEDDTPMERECQ